MTTGGCILFYCCLPGWKFKRNRFTRLATGWALRRCLFKNMQAAAEESEVCIASAFIIFCLPRGWARSPSWKNKRALNHWRVLRRVDPFCARRKPHTLCHWEKYFSHSLSHPFVVDHSLLMWLHSINFFPRKYGQFATLIFEFLESEKS